MKRLILLAMICVSGCAQLSNIPAAEKPRVLDPQKHLLVTECNGFANDLGICYKAAREACPAGYSVDEWIINYGSVSRRLIFRCN
jgi:hypothetical protein